MNNALRMARISVFGLLGMCLMLPTGNAPAADGGTEQRTRPGSATANTRQMNRQVLSQLDFSDRADFAAAQRGLIAPFDGIIRGENGQVIWDMQSYAFLQDEIAPDTVNPSLWRQERLNRIAGLFKVTDHVYQVRGLDLSNMTIIETGTGLVIIDPLVSKETAKAALDLYRAHVSQLPVKAVIYSHSHVDHYGGVKGVVDERDVKQGNVRIYAPVGFMEHAVSENVYAGNAMTRRAQYMYGALLPKSAQGQVGAGLGKTTSRGTVGLIAPTDIIGSGGQEVESRIIDGLQFEFQLTPGTEAPAEMNFYVPQYRALGIAENATRTQHNVLTIRGAQVRDPKVWSEYLDKAIGRYAARSDVLFAQHHWPTWGSAEITAFLSDQRDMYRYIHDQTLRLANRGLTPLEIADTLKELPEPLGKRWYSRGYYGTLSHNVRAVYQRYLGYYDGNPANLNPLPPAEAARRYVDFMGGEAAVLKKARASFEKGDYRWVAEVAKHVVFANPDSREGRALLADALEQMGYQSEAGTWRNAMLMGALELRDGVPKGGATTASPDVLQAMTVSMLFDYLAIRLNGPAAAKAGDATIAWILPDSQERYLMTLRSGALSYRPLTDQDKADATVELPRNALNQLVMGTTPPRQLLGESPISVRGERTAVERLFENVETFDVMFNIVTP
ncbi:alkyl/aryl-sulfatase [Xanthomonas sacchari]|uniref:alkyl/aryl-sulfatase n=1 Tax=Xanthomonas sacchari TaxID=56458 RepID=UPI003B225955